MQGMYWGKYSIVSASVDLNTEIINVLTKTHYSVCQERVRGQDGLSCPSEYPGVRRRRS